MYSDTLTSEVVTEYLVGYYTCKIINVLGLLAVLLMSTNIPSTISPCPVVNQPTIVVALILL